MNSFLAFLLGVCAGLFLILVINGGVNQRDTIACVRNTTLTLEQCESVVYNNYDDTQYWGSR